MIIFADAVNQKYGGNTAVAREMTKTAHVGGLCFFDIAESASYEESLRAGGINRISALVRASWGLRFG